MIVGLNIVPRGIHDPSYTEYIEGRGWEMKKSKNEIPLRLLFLFNIGGGAFFAASTHGWELGANIACIGIGVFGTLVTTKPRLSESQP